MNTAPKTALLPAALLATLVLPATAHALAEFARGSLTLTTIGRISYDTNLLGNSSELDDTIYTLAPTFAYRRAAGLGTIDASAGVSINRYADFTNLDNEGYHASLRVDLPTPEGARQEGVFSANYSDTTDVDETVGARVRATTWGGRFSGTYRAGPRVDLRTNLAYTETSRDVFTDRTQWNAGAGFDYNDFLGGFGLGADYRYTDTVSNSNGAAGSIDQQSHSLSSGLFYKFISGLRASADVGYRWLKRGQDETLDRNKDDSSMTFGLRLTGPFLPPTRFPKLESSFSIGYEQGEAVGLNDHGRATLVGNLSLSWHARERTVVSVNASRQQGLSADNLSTVSSSLRLGVTQRIGQRTRASLSLAEEWADFPSTSRNDERTRAGLNLSYSINRTWAAGADYTYTNSRSNNNLLDYDRHVIAGFVSCTF
ncbi:MAG TPA: outer membrane beta-barrel protein [Opitutaceae bacterium]|nr:outer membrane beta-barrel protein [Opitutaceae bacterium]